MSAKIAALCIVAAGLLSGCGLFDSNRQDVLGRNDPDYAARTNDPYHTSPEYSQQDVFSDRFASTAGPQRGGLMSAIFGNNDKSGDTGGGGGGAAIGVNSYLWRATLDTINFMPLASADPFGGVIITDWYLSLIHISEPTRP